MKAELGPTILHNCIWNVPIEERKERQTRVLIIRLGIFSPLYTNEECQWQLENIFFSRRKSYFPTDRPTTLFLSFDRIL